MKELDLSHHHGDLGVNFACGAAELEDKMHEMGELMERLKSFDVH